MPKYFEETPEEAQKPRRACEGLREDLKQCLVDSDCVRKVSSQYLNFLNNLLNFKASIPVIELVS